MPRPLSFRSWPGPQLPPQQKTKNIFFFNFRCSVASAWPTAVFMHKERHIKHPLLWPQTGVSDGLASAKTLIICKWNHFLVTMVIRHSLLPISEANAFIQWFACGDHR